MKLITKGRLGSLLGYFKDPVTKTSIITGKFRFMGELRLSVTDGDICNIPLGFYKKGNTPHLHDLILTNYYN